MWFQTSAPLGVLVFLLGSDSKVRGVGDWGL